MMLYPVGITCVQFFESPLPSDFWSKTMRLQISGLRQMGTNTQCDMPELQQRLFEYIGSKTSVATMTLLHKYTNMKKTDAITGKNIISLETMKIMVKASLNEGEATPKSTQSWMTQLRDVGISSIKSLVSTLRTIGNQCFRVCSSAGSKVTVQEHYPEHSR